MKHKIVGNPLLDKEIGSLSLAMSMKANVLRGLQSATGEELRPLFFAEQALMPSVLDRAFKGELS